MAKGIFLCSAALVIAAATATSDPVAEDQIVLSDSTMVLGQDTQSGCWWDLARWFDCPEE